MLRIITDYITTEFSEKDRQLLSNLFQELEAIHIQTVYHRTVGGGLHAVKTGTTNQRDARQTCFGKVKYRGRVKDNTSMIRYPHMMPLFKDFVESHYPTFLFTSVYVNKNTVRQKHLDSKNAGESLLVGLGNYTEGATVLFLESAFKHDISSSSLLFNGSLIPHMSEPFTGVRYSLVFFNL